MLPLTPQSRVRCLGCRLLGCRFGFRDKVDFHHVPKSLQSKHLQPPLAWKESNLRPTTYKVAALTTELHASSRAGGIRTHTHLIKSQGCFRYTTTLWLVARIRLHRRTVDICFLSLVRVVLLSGGAAVVALGIELRRRSA